LQVYGQISIGKGEVSAAGGMVTSTRSFILGVFAGDIGILNIDGGTVNADWLNAQGCHIGGFGTGIVNMTEGVFNIAHSLRLSQNGGTGQINLDGGTINLADNLVIPVDNANIDITEGELIVPISRQGAISTYISTGRITAFNGTGVVLQELINDGNLIRVYAPEPTTMILLVLGSLYLRHRRYKNAGWLSSQRRLASQRKK